MTDPKQDTEFKGIIAWWASNGVAANLLMLVAIVGGILGLATMNREVFPTASFAGATVSVAWPGASPQEMEEQIVVRIEEAVSSVDGIENMTSTAREGSAFINIEGSRSVDMRTFINEIEQQVNSVNNLPPSAYRPIVNQWRNEDQVVGFAVHGHVPRRDLQRIAREIRDEVSADVPGVSLVQIWATLNEEVSIEVNENDLRRYNLTFDEVARALRNSSLNASAGQVRTDIGDVSLTARQLGDSADDFERIVVRQTSDGGTIRISDIASVTDGFVDANLVGTYNSEPMALVVIVSSPNMDVVEVSDGVQAYIERRQATLPEGVSMSLWWNNAEMYEARVDTVMGSATWGMLFVLIALVLFLRPVVALWVTVGIGVAFLGAFLVLPLLGVTLNMLSLFAFLIVIGIVVDDAIIVGENIHDRVERGETGLTAAVVGTQMVAKPVIFAVITTILMFAPWMMLSGPEVQFTRQISLVVIAALTFSLIESLFILPAHLAHLKPEKMDGFFGPLLKLQRAIADTMIWFARHVYRHAVVFAVQRRYSTLIFFTGLFMVAIALQATNRVGSVFMPEIENETIQASIQLAEGTPWSRTEQVRQQLERAEELTLEHYREVYPGEGDMIESRSTLATDGRVRAWITLAEPEVRPGGLTTREVAQQLRDFLGPIPDAEEVRLDTTLNNGGSGLRFAISGQDLDELRLAADELKEQLRSYDTLYDVVDNMQSSAEELQFTLRPDAQALGITLADVTRQVRQAFYGEEVVRLPRNGQDVRVMLRLPEEARRSLDTLRNFRIRTTDGREVPLSAVADVEFAPGLNRINRRDRMRTITVAAELTDPTARGEVMDSMASDFWPAWQERHPNVSREEFGQAEGEAEFMAELANLVILVLGGIYILLAIAFRSYAQPALIMIAIPFAYAGAVFGHLLFGMPFALFSFFGVGAAAGVVINDNLVLVDFVNRLRANGVGAFQALVDAGVQRFRPIILTSVTTFLGILPMMAETSTQAQFLKPMVVSLGFAVVFALFLTLLLVPALYAIGVDIKRGVVGMWTGQKLPGIGSTYHETEGGKPETDVGTIQPAE
ncbi:efflux RND transporter permease subunit [Hyphobacterium indicum]|uniref:efflux RND transporter permease subunit n=1 Tax=Hyphobacterium indicum TaxID=2162714 RepID=UPI000D645722|nr:efflux RND transporter permease subunit [Hyphobacterium indicum]